MSWYCYKELRALGLKLERLWHEGDPALLQSRVSSKQSNLFSVRTETNRNSICFGCFSVCFAKPTIFFRFVSVFRTGIETTETNRKNLWTTLSTRVSSKRLIFFRFEPKQTETQSVSVVFQCVFSRNPPKKFSVCFGVSDRYRNNRNKQNLWYGELKRFIF